MQMSPSHLDQAWASLPSEVQEHVRVRLAKDLVAAQYPRLTASDRDRRIPLANVFVDLSVARGNEQRFRWQSLPDNARAALHEHPIAFDTLDIGYDEPRGTSFFKELGALLEALADEPRSQERRGLSQNTPEAPDNAASTEPSTEHARQALSRSGILIGGPGQGKSTVAQYLCQRLRLRLLSEWPPDFEGADDLKRALMALEKAEEELPSLEALRFPLFVELAQLSRLISEGQDFLMLDWLAQRYLGTQASVEQNRSWFLGFFEHMPLLLVLDGLDEVPVSANRVGVLETIEVFMQRLPNGCDLVVLGTTRPQGYFGEFESLLGRNVSTMPGTPAAPPHKWELIPMESGEAGRYAAKLLQARLGNYQEERLNQLHQRVEEALAQPHTQPLTTSPLMMTILCTLVEEQGRPPAERWRIFHEYYQTLKKREQEKELPQRELLRAHGPLIEQLHREIGYRLQLEAEGEHGTASELEQEQFEALVQQVLEQRGFEGNERKTLQERLQTFALERLVMLSAHREGYLSFEVRSVQEFWAAQKLHESSDDRLTFARLEAITLPAHWQNVWRMALAQALHQREGFFEPLRQLLERLNQSPEGQLTYAGSFLALELLEERFWASLPREQRGLGTLALGLLQAVWERGSRYASRLAAVYEGRLEDAYERALGLALAKSELRPMAIELLFHLECLGHHTLVDTLWPTSLEEQLVFLELTAADVSSLIWDRRGGDSERWVQRLTTVQWKLSVEQYQLLIARLPSWGIKLLLPWHPLVGFGLTPIKMEYDSDDSSSTFLSDVGPFKYMRLYLSDSATTPTLKLDPPDDAHPDWLRLLPLRNFWLHPSPQGLAEAIRSLHGSELAGMVFMPWILEDCLRSSDPLALAVLAEQGHLGTAEQWKQVEDRWDSWSELQGEAKDLPTELRHTGERQLPFEPSMLVSGLPRPLLYPLDKPDSIQAARKLHARGITAPNSLQKSWQEFTGLELLHVVADALLDSEQPKDRWREWSHYLALIPAMSEPEQKQVVLSLLTEATQPLEGGDTSTGWVDLYTHPEHWGLLWLLVCGAPSFSPQAVNFTRRFTNLPPLDEWPILQLNDTHDTMQLCLTVYARSIFRLASPQKFKLRARLSLQQLQATPRLIDRLLEVLFDPSPSNLQNPLTELPNLPTLLKDLVERRAHPGSRALLHLFLRNLPERMLPQLEALVRELPPTDIERSIVGDRLWQQRMSQASELNQEAVATRLKLPLYGTHTKKVEEPAPKEELEELVQLEQLEVKAFRGLEELRLSFKPVEQGQWTFLIGDNATGKSTLLRALALGLTPQPLALKLLQEMPAPSIHLKHARSTLQLTLTGGGSTTVTMDKQADDEVLEVKGTALDCFVVGYGVVRHELTEGSSHEDDARRLLRPLLPLLGKRALTDPQRLLVEWEGEALRSELKSTLSMAPKSSEATPREIFELLKKVMEKVLSVELDEIKLGRVWVRSPTLGRVPFASLSDGYLATGGWIIDMLAQYIDWCRHRKRPIRPDFHLKMSGLVLLDELDLHLHPRWQWKVVEELRRLFPRLSFMVTTHNPMTLLGAKGGEVIVLERTLEGKVEARQQDLPQDASSEVLLTGPWFGLLTTHSRETLEKLDQYRQVVLRKPGSEEAKRLEAELRTRLGSFSNSSLERMAWRIAAEVMEKTLPQRTLPDLTVEERERLREKVKERLRQREVSS